MTAMNALPPNGAGLGLRRELVPQMKAQVLPAIEVIDPVWDLLAEAYECFGVFPTLLELDFNLPPLPSLVEEVEHIARLQAHEWTRRCQRTAQAGGGR